mgnify:CR=1 FL=1
MWTLRSTFFHNRRRSIRFRTSDPLVRGRKNKKDKISALNGRKIGLLSVSDVSDIIYTHLMGDAVVAILTMLWVLSIRYDHNPNDIVAKKRSTRLAI